MIVIDTDILSTTQHPTSAEARAIQSHLIMLPGDEQVGTTIISYDEQTRGWFKHFKDARTRAEQLKVYLKLFKHLTYWQNAHVLPFDEAAAHWLERLHALKLRIGTNDLRIASIALSLDATLVTRNIHDFGRIPGLRVEDWTKP